MTEEKAGVEVTESGDGSMENRYLIFDIRDELYAIEISLITEIVEMLPVTAVPSVPGFIIGIINLRGAIIPIIDVRMRFGYETKEYDSRTCIIVLENNDVSIGLIVDQVREVAKIDRDIIAKPPATNGKTVDYYIKGIARWRNEIQLIIEPDKFFELNEQVLNAVNG
jgi:purine-binding chemotaxis protein CheW